MITDLILPLSIVLGLFNFVLITRWYLMPWIRARNRAEALTPFASAPQFPVHRNGFPDPRCHYRTSGRQIRQSSRLRGSSCSSSRSPGHRRLERQLDNRYTTCLGIQPPGVTGSDERTCPRGAVRPTRPLWRDVFHPCYHRSRIARFARRHFSSPDRKTISRERLGKSGRRLWSIGDTCSHMES